MDNASRSNSPARQRPSRKLELPGEGPAEGSSALLQVLDHRVPPEETTEDGNAIGARTTNPSDPVLQHPTEGKDRKAGPTCDFTQSPGPQTGAEVGRLASRPPDRREQDVVSPSPLRSEHLVQRVAGDSQPMRKPCANSSDIDT